MIAQDSGFGRDVDDPDADIDPLELLALWLLSPESGPHPIMTVSTVGADGYPDARNLLLSAFDGEDFFFHTDSHSRKVAELDADGRVSLVLVWPEVARQLAIQGDAVRSTPEEEAAAFADRSRYLQLLAWLNSPETATLPRAERQARWASFEAAHPDGLEVPATWTGFRVHPRRLTFWRGDPSGPSNRVEYLRTGSTWTTTRLPG